MVYVYSALCHNTKKKKNNIYIDIIQNNVNYIRGVLSISS